MVYPLGHEVSHSVLRTLDCGSSRNFYVVRSFDEMKAILSAVLNPVRNYAVTVTKYKNYQLQNCLVCLT